MVKKPKVREEQFKLVKDEIAFWETSREAAKTMFISATLNRNKQKRILKKLEKRYSIQ